MEELYEKRIHGRPEFPFAVYSCSLEENRKGYPLHWHEELELLYVVSGAGSINIQGEQMAVETGDVVLIPPQRVHGIGFDKAAGMTHYALLFRPSMLGPECTELLCRSSRAMGGRFPKGSLLNTKISPLILELSLNRKKANTDYALMILSHLYAIAYYLVHEIPADEAKSNDRSVYDRLKVILEYLQENYAEEITVEQAAQMCGFSSSHFMKLFRDLTGSSFTQYVKNLRLDTAAGMLRTTGKRVNEIAEAVGFRNLPYFTRAFGGRFHMSPVQYRENS